MVADEVMRVCAWISPPPLPQCPVAVDRLLAVNVIQLMHACWRFHAATPATQFFYAWNF